MVTGVPAERPLALTIVLTLTFTLTHRHHWCPSLSITSPMPSELIAKLASPSARQGLLKTLQTRVLPRPFLRLSLVVEVY
jgi:hypothetical protein